MTDIIVFDWETTSAKPESARGVQFAAYSAAEGALYNDYCDPEVDIHHEASEVHGITPEMVAGKPKDYAFAADFLWFLEDRKWPITAGHNSSTFDIPITNRLAKMGGSQHKLRGLHIDTCMLAGRVWPDAPSYRLSATEDEAKKNGAIGLTQWLGLGSGEGAHDALADCRMVLALIDKIRETNGMSVEQLAEWAGKPFVHEVCIFGKHRGKKWGRGPGCVPFYYVKWCTENWQDASLDLQATVLYHYGLRFKFKGAL